MSSRLGAIHPDTIGEQLLQGVVRAADNGDWETFTDLVGGSVCARKERPIRPMLLPKKEESKYGEITRKLEGL